MQDEDIVIPGDRRGFPVCAQRERSPRLPKTSLKISTDSKLGIASGQEQMAEHPVPGSNPASTWQNIHIALTIHPGHRRKICG